MIIECGAPFAEDIDPVNRDEWIIFQNFKWNVLSVTKTDRRNEWNDIIYVLEIEPRKDCEQLCLF